MTPSQLFQLSGPSAMLGWLCLLTTPLWPSRSREWLPRFAGAIAIPAALAALYTVLIVSHWAGHTGGFNSLSQVMQLFTDPWLVLAGWIHYLAFDLFLGGWELADSRARGIPHWSMIPILLLTFFFGPIGFLSYLTVRVFFRRSLGTTLERPSH